MSEEKSKRNPVDAMFPDIEAGEKPPAQCPRKTSWHQVAILVGVFVTIALVGIMLDLSEKEIFCGLYAFVLGLGMGEISAQSRARRMNERDPIHAICLIVQGMDETQHQVFTREEERAVAKLQRILKVFQDEMPR